jgi:sterol desaturase/sphingolipid hydroxylase (fatty acid hydroxylase superfamily)
MDPQKRIYWGYLLSSAILLFLFRHKIATKKLNWMTRSSVVDLSWLVVNQLLLKFWIAPFFALQISTILWLNTQVIVLFGRGDFFDIDTFSVSLLFASVLFLVNDFCKFLVHLGFHKMPLLWPFHAVHHSAETLTPLSLYRIHPVEFIVNSLRSFTVGVMVSTLFIYLFANHISVLQIIGVNLFVFIFNLVGSNLRHSPFYLGFGRLERLFISPAQHQIHHSVEVEHYDKNFGSALAIWDGFFNTLILSKTEQVNGFGLDKKSINRQTIKQQWWGVRDK